MERWQRDQYVLTLVIATTFVGFDFSTALVPLYIRQLGDYSTSQVAFWSGVVIGLPPGISVISGPFWGAYADRIGRKTTVGRAIVMYGITQLLISQVTELWQLVALRSAQGAFGGYLALVMSLALTHAPRERSGQVIGTLQLGQFIPLAVGPPVGGLIADTFGIPSSFMVGAAFCALSYFLSLTVADDRDAASRGAPDRRASTIASFRTIIGTPGMAALLATLFLAQFVERSYLPLLSLFMETLGAPTESRAFWAGLGVTAGGAGIAVSGWVYGRLSGRLSASRLLVVALCAGAVLAVPVAAATSVSGFLLARAVMALLAGGAIALTYTAATHTGPPGRDAMTLTVLGSMNAAASALSPWVAGSLAAISIRGVFSLNCGLYAVAALLVVLARRRESRRLVSSRGEP
ncbi:MAG: MFS transporter [Chloroflexota bacterium]